MANGVINHIYVSIIKLHIKILDCKTQGSFLLDEHLICWEGDGPRPREQRAWKLCIISGPQTLPYSLYPVFLSCFFYKIHNHKYSIFSVFCDTLWPSTEWRRLWEMPNLYLVSWAEVWVSWHPTCGRYLKGGQSAEELPFSLWHLMLLT